VIEDQKRWWPEFWWWLQIDDRCFFQVGFSSYRRWLLNGHVCKLPFYILFVGTDSTDWICVHIFTCKGSLLGLRCLNLWLNPCLMKPTSPVNYPDTASVSMTHLSHLSLVASAKSDKTSQHFVVSADSNTKRLSILLVHLIDAEPLPSGLETTSISTVSGGTSFKTGLISWPKPTRGPWTICYAGASVLCE